MRDPIPTVPTRRVHPILSAVALLSLFLGLFACSPGQQPPTSTPRPGAAPVIQPQPGPSAKPLGPRSLVLNFQLDTSLAKAFSIKVGTLSECAAALTDIKTTLTLPGALPPGEQMSYQNQGMTVSTQNGKTTLTFANSLTVVGTTQLVTSYAFGNLPSGTAQGRMVFKNSNFKELGFLTFTASIPSDGGANVLIQLRSNNTDSSIAQCPELAALISGGIMTATGGEVVAYVPPVIGPTPESSASASATPILPVGPTPAPIPTPPAASVLPQIASLSATSGSPLDTVIITGTGFTNARLVKFNSVNAFDFTVDSDTQITALVPNGFTPGLVQVGNSKGTVDSAETFTLIPISRPAQTTYVRSDGTGDGSSWGSAAGDLRKVLYLAQEGDQIWVAAGTYKPTTNGDRTLSFQLRKNVALYGGFAGTETTLEERVVGSNQTILSGDLAGDDNYLDDPTLDLEENSVHVVRGPIGVTGAILDGFTIQGGNANSFSPHDRGGGILLEPSAVTMNNLQIIENHSFGNGAGMYHGTGASAVMTAVSFNSNIAGQNGGGMFAAQGSLPSLNNVTFGYNEARSGGGMYNDGISPIMIASTFQGNLASLFGGGMYNRKQAGPVLSLGLFQGNRAALGGAMYNIDGASPEITQVLFTENEAENGAGIYNYNESSPILNRCQFLANTAVYVGGGMYNYKYTGLAPAISNSVFSGNKAANGGGMANRSGAAPKLTNVVLVNNIATAAGGGIYNYNRGNPKLRHVTMSNNQAPSGPEIYAGGISNPVLTSSIVWNDTATLVFLIQSNSTMGAQSSTVKNLGQLTVTGYGNLDIDPLFVDTINPMGPDGLFMTADDGLRLSIGSLSRNYGVTAGAPLTDILGVSRLDPPDQGAYEGEYERVSQPMVSEDQVIGTGEEALTGDTITVNYIGALTDGTVFDSSYAHGGPYSFTLGANQVIKGWDQGIPGIKVGGVRKLTIPPELGYGSSGIGTIPPYSTLVFVVELISVQHP
ncbi:MAG: FKBP-type peptidyl-prolyl cis-trans isomerase, partial [Candidatus Sericytochromatia bacterium]